MVDDLFVFARNRILKDFFLACKVSSRISISKTTPANQTVYGPLNGKRVRDRVSGRICVWVWV
jgi:hypothetical protein